MQKHTHWLIVDRVETAEYQYLPEDKGKSLADANTKENVPVRWIDNYGELENKRVAFLIVKYEHKPDELIFTDDRVYILNDKGDTVDKIYG